MILSNLETKRFIMSTFQDAGKFIANLMIAHRIEVLQFEVQHHYHIVNSQLLNLRMKVVTINGKHTKVLESKQHIKKSTKVWRNLIIAPTDLL